MLGHGPVATSPGASKCRIQKPVFPFATWTYFWSDSTPRRIRIAGHGPGISVSSSCAAHSALALPAGGMLIRRQVSRQRAPDTGYPK